MTLGFRVCGNAQLIRSGRHTNGYSVLPFFYSLRYISQYRVLFTYLRCDLQCLQPTFSKVVLTPVKLQLLSQSRFGKAFLRQLLSDQPDFSNLRTPFPFSFIIRSAAPG